jgi:hypothetical protein
VRPRAIAMTRAAPPPTSTISGTRIRAVATMRDLRSALVGAVFQGSNGPDQGILLAPAALLARVLRSTSVPRSCRSMPSPPVIGTLGVPRDRVARGGDGRTRSAGMGTDPDESRPPPERWPVRQGGREPGVGVVVLVLTPRAPTVHSAYTQ